MGSATIDEMLDLMTKQIMQIIAWTQAEGFLDAYRNAGPNARGVFHTASIKGWRHSRNGLRRRG